MGDPDFTKEGRWAGFLDSFLLSYSQIIFSRDRRVGALMFAATALHPDLFIGGLIAVLLVNLFAHSLHFGREAIRIGMFGYNGLLVGLAFPYFFKIDLPLSLVFVLAIFTTTLITAALRAALGYYFNLPALTIPFLIIIYLVLAASPGIQGMASNLKEVTPSAFAFSIPEIVTGYFKSLGAILFMPDMMSGVILFAALLIFSRIATLLSFIGFAIALVLIRWVFNFPAEHLYLSVGFNFILTSIAIGGIWFVPQKTSFLLAGSSILLCALILVGSARLFSFFGLPALILPFNLTLLTFLYGMRQRTLDFHPKTVDFESGTPESNLAYYQTRIIRFGSHFNHPISLPFLGTWTCSQGHSGPFTHQAFWEHSFDFEVRDGSGRLYKNEGQRISDYLCYKLPVLACADGQIAKVVNYIPDNPIGEPNPKQNWGNLVMIQHEPSLFSMVCHLATGSPRFREGDSVRRGDIIGLCGNSGRSSLPHLHFQLQNTSRVGSPTIHSEFHELILEGESPLLQSTYVPRKGDRVRNVRRVQEIADHFIIPIGEKIQLACRFEDKEWKEEVEPSVDLFGHFKLLSLTRKALLHFENKNSVFVIYNFEGCHDSALFVLYASAPRAPYESPENLTYADTLPLRHFFSRGKRVLSDLLAPFFNRKGLRIDYRCERKGSDFIISGSSMVQNPSKNTALKTRAIFREGKGWVGGYLILNGKRMEVVRPGNEDILK
ncbi:MAG: urea transporter [Thermodesulfobacteriota bacterium]|nr:urea transporter [Thermodesulfobacteriota bacterium]